MVGQTKKHCHLTFCINRAQLRRFPQRTFPEVLASQGQSHVEAYPQGFEKRGNARSGRFPRKKVGICSMMDHHHHEIQHEIYHLLLLQQQQQEQDTTLKSWLKYSSMSGWLLQYLLVGASASPKSSNNAIDMNNSSTWWCCKCLAAGFLRSTSSTEL